MQKSYYNKTSSLVSFAIVSAVALVSSNVYAADAVAPKPWTGGDNIVGPGETISVDESALKSAYSDNPSLNYSAWAHTGDWFVFQNTGLGDVTVTVNGSSGFVPGVTVWATGANPFDGGTEGFGSEISLAGFGTPHSFNATGAMGDDGTLWMANGQGGNVLETLGYAVSGPSHTTDTGWGESILNGAHDVSLTNTFENGIGGSVGAHTASLAFNDLAPGWYTVYVGGTDHTSAGGAYTLTVSAVPEAETWAMLLAGLGLVGWRMRKHHKAAIQATA
ncbi:FxDxF family PEP-CTERM protein [Nitrosomonas sp.]|uniref:FxDxF family PEP-CTERM protein n=1 Tax=Nitrosomonas sp. TaxID=42353 RepID=UPI001D1D4A5E|nr:FxDxF family PEP-CTERM protein [Nitrosomonas sp.]MBX3616175.1 FxDxF family PEP-CTERM protein [Nitrosomonas sp.]